MKILTLTSQLSAFACCKPDQSEIFELLGKDESILGLLLQEIVKSIEIIWKHRSVPFRGGGRSNQDLTHLDVDEFDAIGSSGGIIEIPNGTGNIGNEAPAADGGLDQDSDVALGVRENGGGRKPSRVERKIDSCHTSKSAGVGMGRGLCAVLGILNRSGGHARASNKPQISSQFTVLCPETNASTGARPDGILHSGTETVLLVEDEPAFLRIAAEALRFLGYTVVSAPAPEQAVRRFHDHPDGFDVLITDVIMPEMHGPELSRRLTGLKPDLKTLYMSGYSADILVARGLLGGRESLLQKPFTLVEMAVTLRVVLDGHASA